MNHYIIVGILLSTLGTFMILYNFSNIVGILLNGLGLGILVYGQIIKSKVDSAEVSRVLQCEINNVLKRIDEIREGEKDEASAGKIDQIEQEFKSWATDFLKNREQRKLELNRTQIDLVEDQLKVSNEWRPIFEYVLTTIESMAKAYNQESGGSIKINFPALPQNLHSEEAINYSGEVAFSNNVVWRIHFSSSMPQIKGQVPSMIIDFQSKEDRYRDSWLLIHSWGNDFFNVHLEGQNVPIADGIQGTHTLDSYRDSLKTILRRLFEAQLLQE